MKKTVVINVVGLTKALIGRSTPLLARWLETRHMASLKPMFPSLTNPVQSTFLTGKLPEEHGIVGNGWYDREECEIKFWKQSNKLVQSEKIWDRARRANPNITCSVIFWWYNMYSTADYSVTPRPNYLADGRKIPDCYSVPAGLRDRLQKELGPFPLFQFWGPGSGIRSSEWIAEASKRTDDWHDPTLTFIYLPHLDYALQRFGNDMEHIAKPLGEIDLVCSDLIRFYENKGARVILVSEYGITDVTKPVHINRVLRAEGLLEVRKERGLELLDPGASQAFAVSDHQIAHIYVRDRSSSRKVRSLLERLPGVEQLLDRDGKRRHGISHDRSGDFIAVAAPDSWFTYYYWLDDHKAPDFARLVDIHKKPGYDPLELFIDPKKAIPKVQMGFKLLQKILGFRYLMDFIPLDASLVRGSHGRMLVPEPFWPILAADFPIPPTLEASQVYGIIWETLMG